MSCPTKPIIKTVLTKGERDRYHKLMNTPLDSHYVENVGGLSRAAVDKELALLKKKAERETSWWMIIGWALLFSLFATGMGLAIDPVVGAFVLGVSLSGWIVGGYYAAREHALKVEEPDGPFPY